MPVQINEVIIRTAVDTPKQATTSAAEPTEIRPVSDIAILELVLEIIKEQTER